MKIKLFKRLTLKICVLMLFAVSIYSCSELPFESKLDHGTIEYTIEYPSIPEDNYMLDLMPKKMTTMFSNGSFRSDIIAGMGLFKTSIICEKDKESLIHSVKMLNKKYVSTLNFEEIQSFNPNFQEIEITPLSETKDIAGYKCKAIEVKVLGDSSWGFTAYFTDEINLENPNQYTPFNEVEGVLMQYEIMSYDTHMRFTAIKVTPVEKEIEIKLEEGYEEVSPERLKEEIESIFAKVK